MNNLHRILSKALEKTLATKRFIQINCKKNGQYGHVAGYATIDVEDYDKVKDHSWCFHSKGYVKTTIKGKTVLMHQLITDTVHDPVYEADHLNWIKFKGVTRAKHEMEGTNRIQQ